MEQPPTHPHILLHTLVSAWHAHLAIITYHIINSLATLTQTIVHL